MKRCTACQRCRLHLPSTLSASRTVSDAFSAEVRAVESVSIVPQISGTCESSPCRVTCPAVVPCGCSRLTTPACSWRFRSDANTGVFFAPHASSLTWIIVSCAPPPVARCAGDGTVRLPQLLAQSALTPTEVTQVQKLLGDFLRFMQKNYATFFVAEYEDEEPVRLTPPLLYGSGMVAAAFLVACA